MLRACVRVSVCVCVCVCVCVLHPERRFGFLHAPLHAGGSGYSSGTCGCSWRKCIAELQTQRLRADRAPSQEPG